MTTDLSIGAQAAIERARDVLAGYASEPGVRDLLDALNEAAEDDDADDGAVADDRLAKALEGVREELAKIEAGPSRDRLVKAALQVERELLARTNPRAAEEWQKTWGRAHGVS